MCKNLVKTMFIFSIFSILLINTNHLELSASSGRLKSESICKGPDGLSYGYHGDDNHWHLATDSGYASGGIISGNPCSTQEASVISNTLESNSNNASNDSEAFIPESIPVQKEEIIKSNEKPEISINTDILLNLTEENLKLPFNDLVSLLDLTIVDKEDGLIDVKPENIKVDKSKNEIIITITDTDDNMTIERYKYEIEKNYLPIIILITSFIILSIAIFFFLKDTNKNKGDKMNESIKESKEIKDESINNSHLYTKADATSNFGLKPINSINNIDDIEITKLNIQKLRQEQVVQFALLLVSMFGIRLTMPYAIIMQDEMSMFTALIFMASIVLFPVALTLTISKTIEINKLLDNIKIKLEREEK